jgi:hypothetical protein
LIKRTAEDAERQRAALYSFIMPVVEPFEADTR